MGIREIGIIGGIGINGRGGAQGEGRAKREAGFPADMRPGRRRGADTKIKFEGKEGRKARVSEWMRGRLGPLEFVVVVFFVVDGEETEEFADLLEGVECCGCDFLSGEPQ